MGIKVRDFIKLGFGFYLGYELAKTINDIGGEYCKLLLERIKKGSC